jgi:predicted AAA+ superfamily ATPase
MDGITPRFALARLIEWAEAFRAVVVTGPRQAGKTTPLQLFREARGGSVRSPDDPVELAAALNDPIAFAEFGATPRMIDEIQRGGDALVR